MSNSFVTVNVSLQNPAITAESFNIPLLLSHRVTWTERVRTYANLLAVAADFATTTPEYAAASAMFAQDPPLPSLKIGRCALKPTMIKKINLEVVGSGHYKINANCLGVTQLVDVLPVAAVAWTNGHGYTLGQRVINDTAPVKVYQCITGGTSAGSGGPTGTAADITDNTAHWEYLGTSDAGVCNDSIILDIVTAINALAAPAFSATATATGTPGALVCTVTGNLAGNWFALEPLNTSTPTALPTLMSVIETTLDPGVATDLTAIAAEDNTWYGLLSCFKSAAMVSTASTGMAAWCEANKKQLIASLSDTVIANVAYAGATDAAKVLKAAAYDRTGPFFHPRDYEWADAAEMGVFFAVTPGQDDWRLRTLSGVTPVSYTGTQETNLKAKSCNYYGTLGGQSTILGNGQESSGQYIDVIRDTDQMAAWYTEEITNLALGLQSQGKKLPYTDEGIAMVESKMRAVDRRGMDAGIVVEGSSVITVPKVADVSSTDKSTRHLGGMNDQWQLQGAINDVTVNVAVTY